MQPERDPLLLIDNVIRGAFDKAQVDCPLFPSSTLRDARPAASGSDPAAGTGENPGQPLSHTLRAATWMPDLMHALIMTHFEFEGWPSTGLQPGPSMKATYRPAAELAVRYASGPCRKVAEGCAMAYAVKRFDDVMTEVLMNEANAGPAIGRYAKDIVDTYLSHLSSGLRSQAEWEQFHKDDADAE